VQITTSLEPNKTLDDYQNIEEESVLTSEMKQLITKVNRFLNLTNIAIVFSATCAVIEADDYVTMQPEESVTFRTKVLKTLLAALNNPNQPLPRLTSLSLKNLQNFNNPKVVESENFKNLLGRLEGLRLKIIMEREEAAPEASWHHAELYNFMTELPTIWLEPARENLARLTLHMDEFWGYLPKADFRGVRFPRLKRLESGNYTFTHDWQLDWIISQDTVVELVLDGCPIIKRLRTYGPLDDEGYVKSPTGMGETKVQNYEGKWSEYFARLEGMRSLKRLRFGVGEWSDGANFDGEDWVSEGIHGNM
jgi:hypothetical protein